jgi:leucyl-tRNA synthetase
MDIIKIYGADAIRMYEMFMGPFDQAVSWSDDGMVGPFRFLERVWKIGQRNFVTQSDDKLEKLLHKTIKKVTEDIEAMRFNTAISSMMILATEMEKVEKLDVKSYKLFLQILSPFAPHITEELWSIVGDPEGKSTSYGAGKKSINLSTWPTWDESLLVDSEVKIIIQINGKMRGEMMVGVDVTEEEIKKMAVENEAVLKYVSGQEIKKVIYVKNRLVNIVI